MRGLLPLVSLSLSLSLAFSLFIFLSLSVSLSAFRHCRLHADGNPNRKQLRERCARGVWRSRVRTNEMNGELGAQYGHGQVTTRLNYTFGRLNESRRIASERESQYPVYSGTVFYQL